MAVVDPSTVQLKEIYDPVAGVYPDVPTLDEISTTRQTYTSAAVTYWNTPNRFTTQGQKWAAVDGGNASQGVQNRATPRGILGQYIYHVTELEYVVTGDGKLDIQVRGTADSAWDIMVWIERGGKMYRLSEFPKGMASGSGMRYRNINLGKAFHGRIRIHTAACIFVGIGHEANTIIRPAPPRKFAISDGDSYIDGQQAQNAGDGATGFFTMGLADQLFEATGMVFARRAQGGTAFTNNGGGPVSSDTVTFMNTARWFAASRKAWMVNAGPAPYDFALPVGWKPLIYLLNGTWNEGAASPSQAVMYARAKECYQWIQQQDPWITTVHVSVEPYWGDASGGFGAAGTVTGPPGTDHPLYNTVLGHYQAAAEVPKTHIVNPFGFVNGAEPWWTGKGDTTTQVATDPASQQAPLTGADHIHGTYRGYQHYAQRIAREMGEIRIPEARAYGHL